MPRRILRTPCGPTLTSRSVALLLLLAYLNPLEIYNLCSQVEKFALDNLLVLANAVEHLHKRSFWDVPAPKTSDEAKRLRSVVFVVQARFYIGEKRSGQNRTIEEVSTTNSKRPKHVVLSLSFG